MWKYLFAIAIVSSFVIQLASAHGMLLEPVARASRWRYDISAPINYDDNGLFCGGFGVQYGENDGKCGVCGDNYALSRPRPNENGGIYGSGTIVRKYKQADNIPTGVLITAHHKGYFYLRICNMDDESESEECFEKYPLKFASGNEREDIESGSVGWYNQTVVLPVDLICEHCVLQWTYVTGNSWGVCEDGSGAIGCGDQEWFRTCSDISIGK